MDDQDVFDEDTEVEAQAETQESEKGEAVEPEVEAKAETEEETTEESPSSESQTVPMSALIAERRKRQEAEERLSQAEQNKAPDPVTDPEGFNQFQESKSLIDKIELTQDLAKDVYEDYDEKAQVFMGLVSKVEDDGSVTITDPALYEQFTKSANPAKFAYQQAKKHLDYVEKSSEDYEKRVEQKVLQRLKESGALAVDVADLPDFANAADIQSINSRETSGNPDRIDVFDE